MTALRHHDWSKNRFISTQRLSIRARSFLPSPSIPVFTSYGTWTHSLSHLMIPLNMKAWKTPHHPLLETSSHATPTPRKLNLVATEQRANKAFHLYLNDEAVNARKQWKTESIGFIYTPTYIQVRNPMANRKRGSESNDSNSLDMGRSCGHKSSGEASVIIQYADLGHLTEHHGRVTSKKKQIVPAKRKRKWESTVHHWCIIH